MESARMKLGKMGEDKACEYLEGMGHTIIERNWRSGHLETDIISLASDGIHFVEVKSRVAPVSADPEENVGYAKQKKLTAGALKYLHSKENKGKFSDAEVFFDVISLIFEGESVNVRYFPQAFIPMYL